LTLAWPCSLSIIHNERGRGAMIQLNLLFTSNKIKDFAKAESPAHRKSRPLTADSQCGKLAKALSEGKKLTTLDAQALTGGTAAYRRLTELRTALKEHNIVISDTWENNGNSKFKRYGIESEEERNRLVDLLV